MAALSGSAAAGREPISLSLDRHSCRRWPAGFRSRARDPRPPRACPPARPSAYCSRSGCPPWRAPICAMALTLEPPSISPTLMDDFGPPSSRVSAKERHGAAQRVHRIADAVIAPAMAARSGEGDFEAPAAEPAGGDVVGVGAVDDQERADLPGERRLLAEVPHAEQIALALLADVGHQQQAERQLGQARSQLFQTRATASSAARPAPLSETPGPVKAAVGIDRDFVLGARRDHRVEVRGERDVGARRPARERHCRRDRSRHPIRARGTARETTRRAPVRERWARECGRAAGGFR